MRHFKFTNLAVCLIAFGLMTGATAQAATLKEAVDAFKKKQYERAAKLFKPLAERGDTVAQYRIAMMHRMGLGVAKDGKEARNWSKLAAKKGSPQAAQLLGSLYYTGEGGEQDVQRAYMWYEVAGAEGDDEAQKERAAIAAKLTPAKVTEARAMAKECKATNFAKCE